MVEAAKGGVNYFDTAPAYFGVKSETVFGEGFREFRRLGLPFYCATKTTESTERGIRTEIDAQLKRLGLEAIDFYHVWCILTPGAWEQRKRDGVLTTFRKLREEGLIRHICVSSHLLGDSIKDLLAEEAFEGVLFGYSAYNFPAREKAFEPIARRHIGCAVMNPLGGGLIPRNPEIFGFIKTRPEQSMVEAALHFLWSHPEITTALVGFSNPGEVREALRAVATFAPVDGTHVARMKKHAGEAFQDLCTGCQYCDKCPEGLPVPKLMNIYDHMKLYRDDQVGRDRLKWHWDLQASEADKCTQCGLCEQECTQHLPIIERLQAVAGLASK